MRKTGWMKNSPYYSATAEMRTYDLQHRMTIAIGKQSPALPMWPKIYRVDSSYHLPFSAGRAEIGFSHHFGGDGPVDHIFQ